MTVMLDMAESKTDAQPLSTRQSAPSPASGDVQFRLPISAEALPYYIYRPARLRRDRPPLVTVHGISRNGCEHAQNFAALAERSGRLVVAPFFSRTQCPRYQKVVADGCRADQALMATLVEVATQTGVTMRAFDLFGFSGGAQFAHRFAMLHPARVRRLALASAGWYTFPTVEDPFPYGLSPDSKTGQHILDSFDLFLRIPTLVLVGEQDTERDAGLRKGSRVDPRQGFTRVERATRWAQAVRAAAEVRQLPAMIQSQTLEGCGHNFTHCVTRAALAERVGRWFGIAE